MSYSSYIHQLGEEFVLFVCDPDGTVTQFLVDREDAPFLLLLGNWHSRYSKRPRATPPVLRKRNPLTQSPVEIRLPVAVGVLRSMENDQERFRLVEDYARFIHLCRQINVQWKPTNFNPQDCRWQNWNNPFIPPIVKSSLKPDYDVDFVPPMREFVESSENTITSTNSPPRSVNPTLLAEAEEIKRRKAATADTELDKVWEIIGKPSAEPPTSNEPQKGINPTSDIPLDQTPSELRNMFK